MAALLVSPEDMLYRPPLPTHSLYTDEYLRRVDILIDSLFEATPPVLEEEFRASSSIGSPDVLAPAHVPPPRVLVEYGALPKQVRRRYASKRLMDFENASPKKPRRCTTPKERARQPLFELNVVRGHRGKGKHLQFFVSYKGYDGFSWQPITDFVFENGVVNVLVLEYAAKANVRLPF